MCISKHATTDQILKNASEYYGQSNTKKSRLIVNDEIITGLKLQMTVEKMGVENGSVIYVEFLDLNNTWPTENLKQ